MFGLQIYGLMHNTHALIQVVLRQLSAVILFEKRKLFHEQLSVRSFWGDYDIYRPKFDILNKEKKMGHDLIK